VDEVMDNKASGIKIIPTDLILNDDLSVYHLNLLPEDIGDTIILLGDRDRVPLVSAFFDRIEVIKEKREFLTHTGIYKGKRISSISTGIGTDNIEIVLNELDALVNIDLKTKTIHPHLKSLKFIRIGTCGTIHADIPVESHIVSTFGLGLDNLMSFYKRTLSEQENNLTHVLTNHLHTHNCQIPFYISEAPGKLKECFSTGFYHGITITAPGFFGPQVRTLRAEPMFPEMIEAFRTFAFGEERILNFEMETSALYGLAKILGHEAVTIDLVLANRAIGKFSVNYKEKMRELIGRVLGLMV
jgi:uridine phosphorylase